MKSQVSKNLSISSNLLSLTLRLLGGVLLITPLLPIELLFGKIKGVGSPATPEQWLIGLIVVVMLAFVLNILLSEERAERIAAKISEHLTETKMSTVLVSTLLFIFFPRPLLTLRFQSSPTPH